MPAFSRYSLNAKQQLSYERSTRLGENSSLLPVCSAANIDDIEMQTYVALLRAVNVGGTGKLPMDQLKAICIEAGFVAPRTYIASGNVMFETEQSEDQIRDSLESQLKKYAERPIAVVVRSAQEIAEAVRRNPFADRPGNRVMVLFSDAPLPSDPLDGASGLMREEVRLGDRKLFIFYPDGQADTRLRLPNMASGTARNMNTVAKLDALMDGGY